MGFCQPSRRASGAGDYNLLIAITRMVNRAVATIKPKMATTKMSRWIGLMCRCKSGRKDFEKVFIAPTI